MIKKTVINKVAVAIINQEGEILVETRKSDNDDYTVFYDLPSAEVKESESTESIACEICDKANISRTRKTLTLVGYVKLENDKTVANITIYAANAYCSPLLYFCEDYNTWFTESFREDGRATAPILALKSLICSTLLQKRRFRAEITTTGPKESIELIHFETF